MLKLKRSTLNSSKLLVKTHNRDKSEKPQEPTGPVVSCFPDMAFKFIDADQVLTKSIQGLKPGENIQFYSWANFNLVRLIIHLIKFTGPVHLMMTSYSFSQKSIESLNSRKLSGLLLSARILTDNRVKSMSPKPFQMLKECFDTRCISVHSKVALLWNDNIKVTIVTSQNATDNPKLERGIIFTDPAIFDFDYKILNHEFNRGATA